MQPAISTTLTRPSPCSPRVVTTTLIARTAAHTATLASAVLQSHPFLSSSPPPAPPTLVYAGFPAPLLLPATTAFPLPAASSIPFRTREYAVSTLPSNAINTATRTKTLTRANHPSPRGSLRLARTFPSRPPSSIPRYPTRPHPIWTNAAHPTPRADARGHWFLLPSPPPPPEESSLFDRGEEREEEPRVAVEGGRARDVR